MAAGVRLDTGPGAGADRGPTAATAAPTAAPAVPPWLSGPLSHIYNLRNAVAVAKHAMLIQQMREMVQAILRIDIPDLADIATVVAMRIHAREWLDTWGGAWVVPRRKREREIVTQTTQLGGGCERQVFYGKQ